MVRSNLVSISVGYPNLFSIKLTNTQSVDTPSPFQQMLQLPVSQLQSYSPILASDFHNIRFVYNGTGIPAWLENISNGVATIWVKLPVSIPANSSITIDMEVDPSLNFDGNYWGEAPQLSPTYGQYDNGANVFNNYWNFAGTTVPSGWTLQYNWSINNGLINSALSTTGFYYAYYSENYSPPIIEDFYANLPTETGNYWGQGFGFQSTTDSLAVYAYSSANPDGKWGLWGANPTSDSYNLTVTYSGLGVYSIYYTSTQSASLSFNYGPLVDTITTDVPSSISPGGFQLSGLPFTVYWLRLRTYPPNGVMPSVEVIA